MSARAKIIDGKKFCPQCEKWLPATTFYRKPSGTYQSYCRPCSNEVRRRSKVKAKATDPERFEEQWRRYRATYRANIPPEKRKRMERSWSMKSRFGITLEQYEEMLEAQDHKCAMCFQPDRAGRALAVDHCHTTGRVRGLLCSNCNTALGLFGDDPEVIRKAIEYIEEHGV